MRQAVNTWTKNRVGQSESETKEEKEVFSGLKRVYFQFESVTDCDCLYFHKEITAS